MNGPPPVVLSGLLNLNKPIGVTSRDVVDRVLRPLRKAKVGHAGTLDPLASGVLVVCIGGATRLIEYVQRMPKTYFARVRLGAITRHSLARGRIAGVEPKRKFDQCQLCAPQAPFGPFGLARGVSRLQTSGWNELGDA